jgi:osmoprotectant transport system substrate-binding protein
VVTVAVLALLGTVAGCRTAPPPHVVVSTLRIAAADTSEDQALAAVYAEGARREGFRVSVRSELGTESVEPDLQRGVADLVLVHAGAVLGLAGPGRPPGTPTPERLHHALQGRFDPRAVAVLDVAIADVRTGVAVGRAFAAAHHLRRLSDLAPLAAGLTFGGPATCRSSPSCLPGLARFYGLRFGAVRTVAAGATTVGALVSGQIQVGLLDSTDAWLAAAPVVLLADDRGLEPPQNVVPLVRAGVLRSPSGDRLRAVVNSISQRLETADLVRLDRAVEIDGMTPARAAARWWDARL